ncbi:unnamed protein product, partial [Musa hybrid cultivar]
PFVPPKRRPQTLCPPTPLSPSPVPTAPILETASVPGLGGAAVGSRAHPRPLSRSSLVSSWGFAKIVGRRYR